MSKSKSIDEEIAELFGRPPEPVLDLTEKRPARERAPSSTSTPSLSPPSSEATEEPASSSAAAGQSSREDLGAAQEDASAPAGRLDLEQSMDSTQSNPNRDASEGGLDEASDPNCIDGRDEGLEVGSPAGAHVRESADETLAQDESPPLSLEQSIARIRKPSGRDDIARTVLSCLGGLLDRAALLKVSSTEISGWMSVGLAPGDAIDGLRLPLTTTSTLAMVAREQKSFVGVLEAVPGDGVLCSLLIPPPSRALLVPVTVAARVVCAVYGDLHRSNEDPKEVLATVEAVAAAMGEGFESLIRQQKSS